MVRSLLPLLALAATSMSAAMIDASSLQLYGVNYNTRSGPDWAPAEKKCKSDAEINADMEVLKTVTSRIRIYSLTDCNQGAVVLKAAKAHKLQLELGLWVGKNEAIFLAEKARLVELIATPGLITKDWVTAIHVGSEAVYRNDVTAAQNIDYMRQIKKITTELKLGIPITIADIGDVYLAHPELVDAVDFVSANGFPFWENKPVVGAAAYFKTRMQKLISMAANQKKEFVISETGWASDGVNVNASIASPLNAAQYLKEFTALASEQHWKYYYFEAFDEHWKLELDPKNTVEGYFGIFHADRTMKKEIASIEAVAPSPSLQETAELSVDSKNAATNGGATTGGASGQTTGGASGQTTGGAAGQTTGGVAGQTTGGASGQAASGPLAHPDCPI